MTSARQWIRERLDAPTLLAGVAVALGFYLALQRTWVCDDAFISFRYADNLHSGQGLVFNAGERVEGYTNLLWTLWCALGLRLGFDAESWAISWGLLLWLATLLLLASHGLRGGNGRSRGWPVAAAAAAVHTQLFTFATGGLETSAFTFLVLAGWLLLRDPSTLRRVAAAGCVLGLASLTRPDGALLFAVGVPYVLWVARPPLRRALVYAAAFSIIWLPAEIWRFAYYGDWVPNTYYAKSAHSAWWSQGLIYLRLYFTQYWALVGALPCLGLLAWNARGRSADEREVRRWRAAALAMAMAGAYVLYVARVGGDFMFARLLLPVTPLLLVTIESGLQAASQRRLVTVLGLLGLALAIGLSRSPLGPPGSFKSGIADEWAFYNVYVPKWGALSHLRADVARRMFAGLDVRVAFMAAEARFVYYAQFPVAVECETGLTDRVVARQPIGARSRIGHEKKAPVLYLIEQRRLHFVWAFEPAKPPDLPLDDYIPKVHIDLGLATRARVLWWDDPLMAELRRRGARFPDVRALLDAYLAQLPQQPPEQVREEYAKWRRFYFDHVNDRARAARFEEYLGGPR